VDNGEIINEIIINNGSWQCQRIIVIMASMSKNQIMKININEIMKWRHQYHENEIMAKYRNRKWRSGSENNIEINGYQ
jgi:hypothetical protein